MKVNVAKQLLDLSGKPLKGADGAVLTLGGIAGQVLATSLDEPAVSQVEKTRRFLLAVKIAGADLPVDLSVEDISLLKRLVDKVFPAPLVSGQFAAIIDPPAELEVLRADVEERSAA